LRLSRRETVMLGILLVIGGFYVFYQFYYHPRQVDIEYLQDENTRLGLEMESLMAKKVGLANVSREKIRLNDELNQMIIKIPPSPLMADIINFMQQSAGESRVNLVSVNYKESLPGKAVVDVKEANTIKPAQSVRIQLTAEGTHAGLLSFLLKIENASRIYSINSGKISLVKRKRPDMNLNSESESGAWGSAGEATVKEPESLTYDRDNLLIVLDISAYYDQSSMGEKAIEGNSP